VLGCTHFPVLAPALRAALGPRVAIVDSAETTASALTEVLAALQLRASGSRSGRVSLLATDGAERFARVGSTFLGRPLAAGDVEIVDLPGTGSDGQQPAPTPASRSAAPRPTR
jgi:glutamate racemase